MDIDEVVSILLNEYLGFFECEATALELGRWVKKIPQRFPEFDINILLAVLKNRLNERLEIE